MAIQDRGGKKEDFDPDKMLPREWAVCTDTKEVYKCFAAGDVRRMATYEEMVENINNATEDVQAMFTADMQEAIREAVEATDTANSTISRANSVIQDASQAKDRANAAAQAAEQYVLGDISSKTVTFTEASGRVNIASNESTATMFGKIKKWFSDLGAAAFKGVANNLTTEADGYLLDARQGKILNEGKVDKVSGKGLSTNDFSNEKKTQLEELAFDSGWLALTPASGFVTYSSTGSDALRCRRVGKVVEVVGILAPTSVITGSSNTVTMFTLPEGFRPNGRRVYVQQGSAYYTWTLNIESSGECTFSRYSDGTGYLNTVAKAGTSSGSWLPIALTYIV